jgi:adenine specific DNA methylase Mod
MNTLYYGDNLKILRDYIKDESVDLIYLDPPFNSNRNYNVLFRNESGSDSESQISAFEDTWHWNLAAEQTYSEDDGLPRNDGRPPKRTPPRPKTNRLALSPLPPDRFALFTALL